MDSRKGATESGETAEVNALAQPRQARVHPKPETDSLLSQKTSQGGKSTKASLWKLPWMFIWEVLAIILSSGILAAIIVILDHYHHHPQPAWKTVSLNSVISWLSTVSKGCVLFAISEGIGQLKWVWFTQKSRPLVDLDTFDGASRGVFGCAGLVWRLRARYFHGYSRVRAYYE